MNITNKDYQKYGIIKPPTDTNEKKITRIIIDSSSRDKNLFPNPNNYQIEFEDDINDIVNDKYDVKRMSEMEKLENYSVDDLKRFLQDAIDREDYENASLIRDEITRKSKVE